MTQAASSNTMKDDSFTRSMRAMPPGSTSDDWVENTVEGQIAAIAEGLPPAALDAWLKAGHLMASAETSDDPDFELRQACAAEAAARAAVDKINGTNAPAEVFDEIDDAWWAAVEAVNSFTPQTDEGVRLKAGGAARTLIREIFVETNLPSREQPSIAQLLAIDTLSQIAGTAVGPTNVAEERA